MRRCVRVEFYDYEEGILLRSSAASPSHLGHSLQVPSDILVTKPVTNLHQYVDR